MTPAFFAPQLKTFLPLFQNVAMKVVHFVDSDIHVLKSDLWLTTARPEVEGRSDFPGSNGTACHQRDHVAVTHNPGRYWRR